MPVAGDQWCSSGHKIPASPANVVLGITDFLLLLAEAPLAVTFLVEQLTLIPLITAEFCSVGAVYPGDPLASDLTDILDPGKAGAIRDKYVSLIKYYAWPVYCVCDTLVPPNTAQPAPPAWPVDTQTPGNLCSPVDLANQLNSILGNLNSLWTLVSLIAMRTGAMSYLKSTSHVVTGNGSLDVTGDIGVLVQAATFQPGTGEAEGDPLRVFSEAFLAFGNSDGWEPRQPLLHVGQVFLGLTPGFTTLGYSSGNATSLTIVELVPGLGS